MTHSYCVGGSNRHEFFGYGRPKLAAEGNRPKTDFMNMRKFQSSDHLSESLSHGVEYIRGSISDLGLVDLLPKRDAIWPLQERAKWLRLAAGIFDLGYKASDGEHTEISIAVVKQEVLSRPRVVAREQTIATNSGS